VHCSVTAGKQGTGDKVVGEGGETKGAGGWVGSHTHQVKGGREREGREKVVRRSSLGAGGPRPTYQGGE